ncbi:hypothetical protein ACE939_06855 [Aquimarina sp. W85]|uniref:hypothetical protein n=1 Tax=Aquimarina rhodophyticola TaxID=3342246 RepID=UPI00366A9765
MKPFRLFVLCSVLYVNIMVGQSMSHSIADIVAAGQYGVILGLLTKEKQLKAEQARLIAQLTVKEKEYARNRNPATSVHNLLFTGAVSTMMSTIETKIAKIKLNLGLKTYRIRHGLIRYEAELVKEEKYFKKLNQERILLNSQFMLSGGVGHNYTALLKLLKRTINVRNRILQIDKNVKSLMAASWLLTK